MMMRKVLDDEIQMIRNLMLEMEKCMVHFVHEAAASFATYDRERAEESRQGETEIDRLYARIDEMCMRVLATQQPLGHDLRFLVVTLKIASEIEQMADQAYFIAKQLHKERIHEYGSHFYNITDRIQAMADQAADMMGTAVQAYHAGNTDLSERVIDGYEEIVKWKELALEELVHIEKTQDHTRGVILDMECLLNLTERMAKRAVESVRLVEFLVTGMTYSCKENTVA